MAIAGHFDQRIIAYPIGPGRRNGELLTNWICQMAVANEAPPREDWNRSVPREQVLKAFSQWRFPWLDLPALIRRTPEIYEFPLVDRDPLDRWTFGRTTLLGDAAHPMYPIGSNGASQAILDGRTLAYELASAPSIDEALARYEAARRPATNRLVLINRANGPEQVMQLAHERAPSGFSDVGDVLTRAELEAVAEGYKKAAGFDRDSLNARPSLSVPVETS